MLSAEQIKHNLDKFYGIIDEHIAEPRKTQLMELYKSKEEILAFAPASSKASFHNSFDGGYIDHVLNVIECAIAVADTWTTRGAYTNTFTTEELVFAALNHDLGKLGLDNEPRYIPNDSEWHIKNQGANYKPNTKIPFLPVQDNSLFILQSAGIQITLNEYIAIKTHDGLYDEGNKAYLISGQNESKLRSCLPLILHQADMMASRIEWEREWLNKMGQAPKPVQKTTSYTKPAQAAAKFKQVAKGNTSIVNALKNI